MGVITDAIGEASPSGGPSSGDSDSERPSPFSNEFDTEQFDISGRDVATFLTALSALTNILQP